MKIFGRMGGGTELLPLIELQRKGIEELEAWGRKPLEIRDTAGKLVDVTKP